MSPTIVNEKPFQGKRCKGRESWSGRMSATAQEYVNNLMLDFRELVLGLQEEQRTLKHKIKKLPPLPELPSLTTASSLTSSTLNSGSTAQIASPVENHIPTAAGNTRTTATTTTTASNTTSSLGTLSSHTTSNSLRPPPYKSLVRVLPSIELPPEPPKPPARQKHRSLIKQYNLLKQQQHTSSMSGRGALIVLEGLDRVGKTTLAKRLTEHLKKTKRQVIYSRFPDRSSPVGKLINEFLQSKTERVDDHVMHLLFSANRWEKNRDLKESLEQGYTVILDRYSYSGIAYSSAKPTLSYDWCSAPERGLIRPDLVIYLELPKEAQYRRPGFGEERFETEELQEKVRRQYDSLIAKSAEPWIRVDVENKSEDEVLGEVILPVKRILETCANKQIEDLQFPR